MHSIITPEIIHSLCTMKPSGDCLALPESELFANYAVVKKCLIELAGARQENNSFHFAKPATEVIDDFKSQVVYPSEIILTGKDYQASLNDYFGETIDRQKSPLSLRHVHLKNGQCFYFTNKTQWETEENASIVMTESNNEVEQLKKERYELNFEEFMLQECLEARRSGKYWNIFKLGYKKPIDFVHSNDRKLGLLGIKAGSEINALMLYYATLVWNAIYAKKNVPSPVLKSFPQAFIKDAIYARNHVKDQELETAIRSEWELETRTLNRPYAITVKCKNRVLDVIALQKESGSKTGHYWTCIHLVSITAGPVYKGCDVDNLLTRYKLNRMNKLEIVGTSERANDQWKNLWVKLGLSLPKVEASQPKIQTNKPQSKSTAQQTTTIQNSIPLSPNDRFMTLSGRITSGFPKNYKRASLEIMKVREWLKKEGIAEAEYRGDDYNLVIWKHLNPKNWSQSDGDSVNQYLFARPDGNIGELKVQNPVDYYIAHFRLHPTQLPEPSSEAWQDIMISDELSIDDKHLLHNTFHPEFDCVISKVSNDDSELSTSKSLIDEDIGAPNQTTDNDIQMDMFA